MSRMVIEASDDKEKTIPNLRPFSHYEVAVSVFNSKGEGPLSEPRPFNTDEGGKGIRKGGGELEVEKGRVPRLKWEEAVGKGEI